MKFRLIEDLKRNLPYMLRNDGKLLEVNMDIEVHPYLIDMDVFSPDELMEIGEERLVVYCTTGLELDSLFWYYNNTQYQEVEEEIERCVSMLLTLCVTYGCSHCMEKLNKYFPMCTATKDTELFRALYINIHNSLNQEFCRVRYSGKYWGSAGSKEIWFRISSIHFNWFNLIWQVVYDNRNIIDGVNICVDRQSKQEEAFYKIDGQEMKNFPTQEFLTLKGNPIIESKTVASKNLSIGKSIFESFSGNPYYQCKNYLTLKRWFLEDINEITNTLSNTDKQYIGDNTSTHTVYYKEKGGCYITLDDYKGEYKDEHPFEGLIVTIVASPNSRGKGITDQLIQQAIKDNPNQTLIAEIDSDNIHSINLFERNGFKLFDEFDNIKFYKFEA